MPFVKTLRIKEARIKILNSETGQTGGDVSSSINNEFTDDSYSSFSGSRQTSMQNFFMGDGTATATFGGMVDLGSKRSRAPSRATSSNKNLANTITKNGNNHNSKSQPRDVYSSSGAESGVEELELGDDDDDHATTRRKEPSQLAEILAASGTTASKPSRVFQVRKDIPPVPPSALKKSRAADSSSSFLASSSSEAKKNGSFVIKKSRVRFVFHSHF